MYKTNSYITKNIAKNIRNANYPHKNVLQKR